MKIYDGSAFPEIDHPETRKLVEFVEGLLERFSYKPNWAFYVEAMGFCRVQIKMVQHTTDVVTSRPGPLIMFWFIESYLMEAIKREEKHFWGLLREKIHEFEIHEADEWLTIDGKRVFDPHKEVKYG